MYKYIYMYIPTYKNNLALSKLEKTNVYVQYLLLGIMT